MVGSARGYSYPAGEDRQGGTSNPEPEGREEVRTNRQNVDTGNIPGKLDVVIVHIPAGASRPNLT